MALPIVEFFTSKISPTSRDQNRPMFTSIPTSTFTGSTTSRIGSDSFDSKLFWTWFENRPEIIGTISIPITDIIGDRPTWTKPNGEPLSKRQKIKAEKYWRDNRGKETVKAWLYDAFMTGDSYLWKGKPTTKEINAAIKEVIEKKDLRITKFQMKELFSKTAQDEDLKKVKMFDYVAASTMRIIHDEFEIAGYEQNSNGLISKFKPEDIIHYRFLTINGRVNGFTPIKALTAEILLLSLVKDNMLAFLENGGSPDKMFILPKEIANSKNHQYLVQELMRYKKIQNHHGNLVFTGDITVEDLQGNPKDLEYKDLALYITSNIAFAFGIPSSRIPYLIGNAATQSGGGNSLAESGYWNKISDFQDSIEDLLNSQLFNELGWAIKFNRGYKQDEIKEIQTKNMMADTIIKYQEIFAKGGRQMTEDKILEILGWNEEDLEDIDLDLMMGHNNMTNQNMQSNSELEKGDNEKFVNNGKRNVANDKQIVNNMQNP